MEDEKPEMKTHAQVLVRTGESLVLTELEVPSPRPGQVVVEIAYSGVCHSQLLEVRGHRGADRFVPHTLGHEGSGTIMAVGKGVAKTRPGDRVVLTWIRGEGADVQSATYWSSGQAVNSGAISTFMRHAVISENRVVPLPYGVPPREAALLGCAVPTGVGMVLHAGVRAEDSVAIFGIGGVGLAAVMGSAIAGAGMIIAVDIVEAKLEQARRAGATHVVDARSADIVAAVVALAGGRGVDHAFETAGRRETMEAAFRATRDGGECVIGGNLPAGETISIDPMMLIRGRRIRGTWGGETSPDQDIPRYAEMYQNGALDLSLFLSHEYQLEEANKALDDLEAGRVVRALLNMRPDA